MLQSSVENLEHLDTIIDNEPYVMAVFSKESCPPCKALDAMLQTISTDERYAAVTRADVKLEKAGTEAFAAFSLRQTPAVVMFKGGQEVYRHTLPPQQAQLINTLDTHLVS